MTISHKANTPRVNAARSGGMTVSKSQTGGTLGPRERDRVAWHISTYSPDHGGSCVEAGPLADGTERFAVRHSHHPTPTPAPNGKPSSLTSRTANSTFSPHNLPNPRETVTAAVFDF
ncbi:DUF397 domain-containing protein [Actinomadura sp. 9N407]|uniref:DUF397 domain-containing protein n=1 Tax=Actinomadura sp. 9N407 TaxID=3375154 RepID=UPI00378E16C3